MQLGPDLIYVPKPLISLKNTKISGSSARNKQLEDHKLLLKQGKVRYDTQFRS